MKVYQINVKYIFQIPSQIKANQNYLLHKI